MNKWQPISSYPYADSRKMRVVIGINVEPITGTQFTYTTDPCCVWYHDGKFMRWTHDFPPTHWMELPDTENANEEYNTVCIN